MRSILVWGMALQWVVLITGCGQYKSNEPQDSSTNVRAHDFIGSSFAVENLSTAADKETDSATLLKVDGNKATIAISKDALEKEFLLQTQSIAQTNFPGFTGLRSRIVAFRQRGDKVYMLEAAQGHIATELTPPALILAGFTITEETSTHLKIDWNEGMAKLFEPADWSASDDGKKSYSEDFNHRKTMLSYIEEARILAPNQLVIRQVGQFETERAGKTVWTAVEAKYYLTPYRPNPNFKRTKTTDFSRMGFFEVMPRLTGPGGASEIFATKFATDKPIVFAVSTNTPDDFKEAVKQGVTYWETALGKGKIKVIDAEEGETAPAFGKNMIQWVDWDGAGFAYADAQMDPRTGEIKHAQIFMTSAFAFIGQARARRTLRLLKDQASNQDHPLRVGVKGLTGKPLCLRHGWKSMAKGLEAILATGPNEETLKRVAQDFVRVVVAHEVGHTLGLRHNFSGSLATNFPLSESNDRFRDYLLDEKVPERMVVSSSVMDYLAFFEDLVAGHQIKDPSFMMSYDKAAIAYLYKDETSPKLELPFFCTDSHVSSYEDCERGDTGATIAEAAQAEFASGIEGLPGTIMETFIAAKTPAFGEDIKSVEETPLIAKPHAVTIANKHKPFMNLLEDDGKLIKIHRRYYYVNDSNSEEVSEAQNDFFASDVERLGGLDSVLKPIPEDFAETGYETFLAKLETGVYSTGTGGNGETFRFTEEELNVVKRKAKRFYVQIAEHLEKLDLDMLAIPDKVIDHPLANDFAAFLAKRIKRTVFAKTEEVKSVSATIDATAIDKEAKSDEKRVVTFNLPKFRYKDATRLLAAGLLRASRSEDPAWGHDERQELVKAWQEELKKHLAGADIKKLDVDTLPSAAARWVIANKDILSKLE